jgi:hypothetical protein
MILIILACLVLKVYKRNIRDHGVSQLVLNSFSFVARVRRRGDRPPTNVMDKYLVNVGRQGIRCLLAVKNRMRVAT